MNLAPLVNWWRRRRWTTPRYVGVRLYATRNEVPAKMNPRIVALVGTADRLKWAIFDCPCGRGHEIALSLQTTHGPHWQLYESSGEPTFCPSVDSVTAYRCHFFLRDGRVCWVHDD
jgi:hypothetical protein